MSHYPLTLSDILAGRLIEAIHAVLNDDDRRFLMSFEAGEPEWNRFPLSGIAELPAPRFKLMNIRKYREAQPRAHAAGLEALEAALS